MKKRTIYIFTFIIVLINTLSVIAADNLTVSEIISKHLDSIGTKAKRAGITNQLLTSSVQFMYKGSATTVTGNAVFASEGEKNLWGILLQSNDYPQDKFSYNGEKTQVAFTKPGSYSMLGDFILSYKSILKEGLLGGELFSSWALNDVNKRQAKITPAGTKKIGDTETYVIEYLPKGGFDLEVKMFFDKQTFHHIRTEYFKLIAARQGTTIDNSAGQSSDRFQIIEEFSNFQNLGGLTLPSQYSLKYVYYNNSPTQINAKKNLDLEWKFGINSFAYNQALPANSFEIETN
ncbi:MAG: hypothetical protein K1X72_16100 [Pyrinomonadaceae bacterium]|nr:hypothetical protein [Pyrinomonadaceae bacterium]